MGGDFYPKKDGAFGGWYDVLVDGCVAHQAELGLTNGEVAALSAGLAAWKSDHKAVSDAKTAWVAASTRKRASRKDQNRLVRQLNLKLQANPAIGAQLKAALGLPRYDTIPTRAAAPASRPLLMVDTSERLQHTITFRDEATPKSRAKPKGAREIQIWAKIGAPAPADPSECRFLATGTRSPLVIIHRGEDGGKAAHYLGRWRNSHGECGPWSETVEATIVG